MKSKGFTLIELLAVIVVLAIIALIATPMVLNTIEKSKKGAASSSAYSYVSALETKLATYMLKNGGASYETGKHTVSELEVEVKGEAPSEGNFCIGENGTITKASININGYVVSYDGKEATTTDLEEVEDITCEVVVPKYYAFGMPTTSSSTDFQSVIMDSDNNVFMQLEGEQLSVCIYKNNTLECFENNNYEEESAHVISVFGEDNCVSDSSEVACVNDLFHCYVYSNGDIYCWEGLDCHLYSDNSVSCD